ncbi:MAG TPA: DUF2846 domain-containing protein [Spongiibacteraceae bacterium]|nr:DUF2846 domain-containing protein [Spongiibacteraceae bacterium]
MLRRVAIIFFILLAGCATLGKPYKAMKDQVDLPPEQGARLVFFRTDESQLYAARAASVDMDGKEIGVLAGGGFFYSDVSRGSHILKTEMWDIPGKCLVNINAEVGKVYYFMVDARIESFWASMAGGAIGNLVESSGKECAGGFRLYPVDKDTAKSKLTKLRYSK